MSKYFWAIVLACLVLEFINTRGLVKPWHGPRHFDGTEHPDWKAFNMSLSGPVAAWRESPLTYCEDTELPRVDEAKEASRSFISVGPDQMYELKSPWPGAVEDPRVSVGPDGSVAVVYVLFDEVTGPAVCVGFAESNRMNHVRLVATGPQKNWSIGLHTERSLTLFASLPSAVGERPKVVEVERPSTFTTELVVTDVSVPQWRGSTNFVPYEYNGRLSLLGLVHRRIMPREAPLSYLWSKGLPMYEYALQLLDSKAPYKCVRMSRPFKLRARSFPNAFTFPMSLEVHDRVARLGLGITDCYAAVGHMSLDHIDAALEGHDTVELWTTAEPLEAL